MKEKLTHNLNLKVLAVLFSIIIWIIVVNIDDPVKSVQFNDIPVQIVNELTLTDKGQVYEIVEGQEKVDVTVSGRRSVIEDLSKDNINVVADMKELGDGNKLHLKVTSNKYSGDIDTMRPDSDTIELNIEELKKIQKTIQVETIGEPAEHYIEGDYTISLNRVNIEGPKSVIDLIQSARVSIDVEGATNSVSASVPIILYDAMGNRVDSSRIKMNLENINVSQEILFTKSLNIVCTPSGEPAEGYKTTGDVEITPSTVVIAGPKAVLDNISQITIHSTAVNVTGQDAAYKTTANIFNYLPGGLESADEEFKGQVSITVNIKPEVSKNYNIYLNKVSVKGLESGLSYEFINGAESATDNRVEIVAYGLFDEFDDVTSSDIGLSVDFAKYKEENGLDTIKPGVYTLPVEVTLPDGLRIDKSIKLRIRVSEEENN